MEVSTMMKNVHWTGHSGIKITGSKIVYVDPYELSGGEEADLILITHGHYDHCSPDDVQKILGSKTTVVVPASAVGVLSGNIKTVRPGDHFTLEGVAIETISMYNIGKRFHPKEKNDVAYVFTVDGTTYFHAGDSDLTPEMKTVRADMVFLPVSGTYCMDSKEAADACAVLKPKAAVPIHWGSITGSSEDAKHFKKRASCDVFILIME